MQPLQPQLEFDLDKVQDAINEAAHAARTAVKEYLAKHGERKNPGFVHVEVAGIHGNTRLGRALKAAGFRKDSTGYYFQLQNPSKSIVQDLDALSAGAEAYREVLEAKLGLKVYRHSRTYKWA
jgi:hypothetical protein